MKVYIGLAAGLLALYLCLAALTTQTLHFSRALDEGYHLEYITFIKQNGRLPITYEERAQIARADYPPLYHLVMAVLVQDIDVVNGPAFKYFGDSFRYRVVDHQEKHPLFFFTEDMKPPYLGRFLVWQRGRLFSVMLSLVALVVVSFTLWRIPVGRQPLIVLAGMALLAFNPRFLFVMSSLNDDSLLLLIAALYFLTLVEILKSPHKWRNYWFLGIVLGLSVTVKYSMVIAPLEILLLLAMLTWHYRLGWLWMVKRLVFIALLSMIFSSWWFGWNIWYLNTVAKEGWLVGLSRSLFAGGYDTTLNRLGGFFSAGEVGMTNLPENRQVGTFFQWVWTIFLTLWAYSVNGSIPAFPYVYGLLALFLGAACVGLYRWWQVNLSARKWVLLALLHTIIFLLIPILRFFMTRRIGETAQGRHILIPAATAIAALIVWGMAAIIPRRWHVPAFGFIISLFIGWSGLHIYHLLQPGTSLLPLRSVAQAAAWLPQPANAPFGENIELVSYELEPQPEQGQLLLNLGWRSLGYVNESYLLQVQVVDEAGAVVTHWLGHHGQGRLPTLAWDPGDSVFDRLTLPLPNLPAGSYQVRVQLNRPGGQPLPVKNADQLTLATFTLASPAVLEIDKPVMLWPPAAADTSFRYPGTIILLVDDSTLTVELLGLDGRLWQPVGSANGVVNFVIGPRWPSGKYQVQLDGQPTEMSVTVENWWPRKFTAPDDIETVLSANFANQIYLLGYSLPQKQVQAGQAFPVTLYWQTPPEQAPQANFIQFNNLRDNVGIQRGGYDRLPLEYYSTLLWAPGEVVVDGYAVPVDPDAPPGDYWLDVGFYLTVGEAAVNLPLVVDGQRSEITSGTIGPVEVVLP